MAQTVAYYYKGEIQETQNRKRLVVPRCSAYDGPEGLMSYVTKVSSPGFLQCTLQHRLPSLISCRKLDFVRPREQNTQVNDKSKIQASSGAEGCSSATSLVITIAATTIGQHPKSQHVRCVLSVRMGSTVTVAVMLCVAVSDVSCRSSIAS